MSKVAPKQGAASHTASIGNRRLGDLRVFYRDYYRHLGEPDRRNPFDGMRYKETLTRKRKRPSIDLEWITGTILKPGALTGLNEEARAIVLAVADIGTRPSEICNLTSEFIVLDHQIPHVKIEPRDDPEDPREIKTGSSVRSIPITGLALAVFKKFPHGFPRYKDKESSLSAVLQKYFRTNNLLPTSKHKIYSLRHSLEDRMKEAKIDPEMRRLLMGHSINRPEYGEGGSLKLRLEIMLKVALPFDPSIV
jgi:integrase